MSESTVGSCTQGLVFGNNNGGKPSELLHQCTFVDYQFSAACNITIALACEAVSVFRSLTVCYSGHG